VDIGVNNIALTYELDHALARQDNSTRFGMIIARRLFSIAVLIL